MDEIEVQQDCAEVNHLSNSKSEDEQFVEDENSAESSSHEKETTIIVGDLRQPGSWSKNHQLQGLLNRCFDFTVKFTRSPDASEKEVKSGQITMIFTSIDSARDAYIILSRLIIDGAKPKLSVDQAFYEAVSKNPLGSYFSISQDQVIRSCTLYALYLPKSADKDMLEHLVGENVINHYRILALPNYENLQQSEIIVFDEQCVFALAGKEFPIDDGEQSTTVKLVTCEDYSRFIKMESALKIVIPDPKLDEAPDAAIEDEQEQILAPEIDDVEILTKFLDYFNEKRINFGEVTEKDELYTMCDAISAMYNGLPDSVLKPVMLTALQSTLNRTEVHWMREQIEYLIKIWKTEVMSESFYERPTVVRMEAVAYKPVDEEQKFTKNSKRANKRAQKARNIMGVGAFLTQQRDRLIVETGEVDVKEDNDGNIFLNGENLSFESWAKFNKTKGSGVVRANDDGTLKIGNGGLSKKQMRMARTVEGMSTEEYKKWRKEKSITRKADMKERIMKRGAMETEDGENELEGEEEEVGGVSQKNVEPKVEKTPKVLDEGEIDSEEEREEEKINEPKKKRKKTSDTSDSDSSESSSSEDDGEEGADARQRRKSRRKKNRKNPRPASNHYKISPAFKAMYDNRKAIIARMSPGHKVAFANVLNQLRQSNASISQSQATQMMNALFSGNSSFK